MSLHLTATLCDHSIKKLTIMPGQTASIGTSLWNEFAIPEDPLLSDVHFEIQYDQLPTIQAGPNSTGLLYGNEVVTTIDLVNNGDSTVEFVAGNTHFRVHCPKCTFVNKAVSSLENESPEKENPAIALRVSGRRRMLDIAMEMSIPVEFCHGLDGKCVEGQESREFVESLCTIGASEHAIKFLARILPHKLAIKWWAISEQRIAQVDFDLWKLIQAWCDGPSEERRAAIAAALVADPKTGISRYVAESVCFTGGSLADAGLTPVPPPVYLPAVALSTAFQLSFALGAVETNDEVVAAGLKIFEQSLLKTS